MMPNDRTPEQLAAENAELRARLSEAEETLYAIRSGEVDALVLSGTEGDNLLELKGGQEPYRVMVEAMNEGAVTLALDGTILYANSRFADWVKVPLGQIIGLSMQGFLAEPDREGFGAMLAQVVKGSIRKTLMLQAADGMQMPAQFSISPQPRSEGLAVSVVIADLSEVVAAAEARTRLALIVESSEDAIVAITLDGMVESWNRAAEKLYGYTAGEACGQPLASLVVPPELAHEMKAELEVIRLGKRTRLEDTVRLRKDGTRVEVSVKASPILDDAGKVVGASINARDITERKRMEAERDRATHLLGERLKELRCLYAVSTILAESGLSVEQRMQRIVETLPPAFQYPEVTCASLSLRGRLYRSGDCKQTPWLLSSPIVLAGEEIGALWVRYTEERPASDEGPFLREERALIDTITRNVTDFLWLNLANAQLQQFRDLLDNSSDSVFVVDPETARFTDFNEHAAVSLGYSRDELLRMKVMDIDVAKPGQPQWGSTAKAVKKAGEMLLEAAFRRKDGSTFPVEVSGKYVSREGSDYIVAIARDITERQENERRLQLFRNLIDHAVDGIEVIDPSNMRILDVNDTECRRLGYGREELLSMTVADIDRQIDQDTVKGMEHQVRETGSARLESVHTRKDGSTFPVEVSVTLIDLDRPYMLADVRDITERKRQEDALRERERDYRTLTQNLPGLVYRVFLLDQGRMKFYNDLSVQLTGYAEDELVFGTVCSIEPLILEDDRAGVVEEVGRAIAERRPFRVEYRLRHKDGSIRWMSELGSSIEGPDGAPLYIDGLIFDITERKQIEEKRNLFRALLDNSNDGIEVLEPDTYRFLDINETTSRMLGYSREELLSMSVRDIDPLFDAAAAAAFGKALRETGTARFEGMHRRKDGSTFPVEVSTRRIDLDRPYLLSIARDTTERRRIQESLRQSEEKFRALVESTSDWIWEVDQDGVYTYVSPRVEELLGYPPEEVLGKTPFDFMLVEERPELGKRFKDLIDKRAPILALENASLHRDGHVVILETRGVPFYDDKGVFAGYRGIDRDITERKKSEAQLKKSTDLLQSVVENAPVRIFWKGRDLRLLGCNTLFARDAGYTSWHVMIGKTDFDMAWKDQAELYRADDLAVMESGNPKIGYEEPQTTPGGDTIWLRSSKVPLRDENAQVIGMLGIYDDITERKQADEALRRANHSLKTLSAGNLALVRATSEQGLLQEATSVIVEQGGYVQAVVGYAEDDTDKSITLRAWSGYEGKQYWAESLSWADTEQGQLPIAKAIRTGKTQICHDIAGDPAFKPWRERAAQLGYVSNIAMPLSDGKRIFGGLSIYSSDAHAFDDEEVRLLEELANDLAYGVVSLRTRKHNEEHEAILRQSLEQSIQTIAATVEARDPYTAGHQRRVADLATAIAREMDLPEEQIDGVYFAATIHDLGKIHVPAEILSKPGKLNEIEYKIIQTHPQEGYEILKDVNFPWPIATIIQQHHEMLDGSGYPQGLKGEQILLEAKIINVADVVEAMSSHRPYREALGQEAALAEIEAQRGVHFDAMVVDTCLKLFRERGYTLPD